MFKIIKAPILPIILQPFTLTYSQKNVMILLSSRFLQLIHNEVIEQKRLYPILQRRLCVIFLTRSRDVTRERTIGKFKSNANKLDRLSNVNI